MIRVSRLADYGILLMTWFAWRKTRASGVEERLSASDLARDTGLPLPTVSKLLGRLARAGLLDAQRGTHGGYSLARSAAEVSVSDVLTAIEGPLALMDCLDETSADCGVESLCPTRTNWSRINQAIRAALEAITLEEMARPQHGWRERMSRSLAAPRGPA